MNWLLLWATLQVGFVPTSIDNGIPMTNVEYVEPGFGATLFKLITIEGSIRTYVSAEYLISDGGFWTLRDAYTIGIRADPTPWLRIGFLHSCSHPDAPYGEIQIGGDQFQTEFYARLKVGG